jgi:hypothetical protein
MASNELELGYGVRLTNPAPVEAIRTKPQIGQAPALGYASVAEACALVAPAVRHDGLTVMVTGVGEYWWQAADLSDAGLKPKGGGNNAGGAGALAATTLTKTATAVTYKLSPDLVPLVRALLDAGQKPVWIMPPGTQTPPVVVVPPTTTQRTMVRLADKGVKNDGVITDKQAAGGTDNAAALMAVQTQYATTPFRQQNAVELVMPAGGIVTYAAGQEGNNQPNTNKWFLHYRDAKLSLNGATLIPTYFGSDNFFSATIYRREMLQNNPDGYGGGKSYFNLPRIATVQAGSKTITVRDLDRIADTNTYFVGARITIMSKEVVLGESAYPPGTKHNERPLVITAINRTTGVIELDRALEYEHRADWPENPQTSGGGSGQGRIVPLDAPGCQYMEYAEFVGPGTLQASNAASPGAFGFIANEVVVSDLTITNGGTVTESLTKTTFNNVAVTGVQSEGGEVEGDKGNGDVVWNNVTVGFTSNWGGTRSFKMVGGKCTESLQLAAPIVELDGVECHASAFKTDNYTVNHPADAAVASYTGFHNTSLYHVKNLKLGADNGATAYLSPLELRSITVTKVVGQKAYFNWNGAKDSPALLLWRAGQPGTRFYTLDGTKVGRQVGQVLFETDSDTYTSGDFAIVVTGFTPAVGDVYEFSNVQVIKDDGGHTILTPSHQARLFSDEALIWKGNQRMDGVPGSVTLTKADLLFKNGGTGAYVVLRGKPTKITLTLPTAVPGGRLLVVGENKARQSQSDVELVRFGLGTTGTRYAGTAGASAGIIAIEAASTTANQYRPAAFGAWAYTLVIYFDGIEQANIPNDFTLTLETDFS